MQGHPAVHNVTQAMRVLKSLRSWIGAMGTTGAAC
jgi:hypothetical protein